MVTHDRILPARAAVIAFPFVLFGCLIAFAEERVTYNRDIRPILSEHCFTCHGPDSNSRKADLRLDNREGAAISLGDGTRVTSELWKRISHTDPSEQMPPTSFNKPLLPEQIEKIGKWLESGAEYEQHWAFLPIADVSVPTVKNAAWPKNAIDAFILAEHERKGLSPNFEADRRTLIRRLHFDLIGLPPTPERVEAFVNDTAPNAYENLVAELLSNPHYGERWARHWLDLARFAESHGYEQDYDRKYAYYYRDFVIEALNQDLPFDTFVKWQIAGDEIAPENPLAMMATGFLAAGTHATQITLSQVEKERYDELDDMARTVGTAMLGLTIGCARCHDHKYDPISMAEYYQFVSTFTKTVRSDYPIPVGPEYYERAKSLYDKEHAPYIANLREYEKGTLAKQFEEWLDQTIKSDPQPHWMALDVFNYSSEGGARFGRLADGSVLVSGPKPEYDTYTFEAKTTLTGITAVRIDALTDPSLVANGPGRAENGNFALSDFKVAIRPTGTDPKTDTKLVNPRATHEQTGLPVANAIDADVNSAWAVGEQLGKEHSAVFDFEQPVGYPQGTTFTFTLAFKSNSMHAIGRPRLSITTAPVPAAFDLALMPQDICDLFAAKRAEPNPTWNERDRARLFDYFKKQDSKWRELWQAEQKHAENEPTPGAVTVLISSEGVPAIRTHTQGGDFLENTHHLRRGDPNQKGEIATQDFPAALVRGGNDPARWQVTPPPGARTTFQRATLANWITDTESGAGQLLARVIVNRLWQHHFNRGIVPTPSDFGVKGEPPSHPELLDWLASELIKNKWSLKHIQTLILTSATYRQSALDNSANAQIDPTNVYVWHYPRQRLEAEIIRDAMLNVAGELDPNMFGPSTLDQSMKRRSIYFMIKRSKLVPMLTVFDAPDATTGIDQRPCTTVAPQALTVMNSPNVRAYAESLARRIAPDNSTDISTAVRAGFAIALGRPPRDSELAQAFKFINDQTQSYTNTGAVSPRETAIADFAQVLLGLNEFVYVE